MFVFLFYLSVCSLKTAYSEEASNSFEDTGPMLEELRWLQAEAFVSIATRHDTPINKAPSIITTITGEEIRNSGFRNFAEILRTIPGFEISFAPQYGNVVPLMRGMTGANKVRVQFNGHLLNIPQNGDAFAQYEDFPVENIKRIEIIRGPGSAMYGENAFLAVINIITEDAHDIDGAKINVGYGRFDERVGNIKFGKTFRGIGISGMYQYRETNGFDGVVDSDAQTLTDSITSSFGIPPASRSPGRVDTRRREYDLNLRLTYKDFYLEGLYVNKNQGVYIGGPQFALTDESFVERDHLFFEAGCEKTFWEKLTLNQRLYYDQFYRHWYTESLPEGGSITIDVNGDGAIDRILTYPDGLIGNGKLINRVAGVEISLDYELFEKNNGVFLVSSWHYHDLVNIYPMGPVFVGTSKGKSTQRRILSVKGSITNINLLKGKKVASAGSEEYTKNIILQILGEENREIVDSLKILTVPKEIDALMAVGFGLASSAITTENSINKLAMINPKQYKKLKQLAASEETLLPIVAASGQSDENIRLLLAVIKKMGAGPVGVKKLRMLGIDGWKKLSKDEINILEEK